MLAAPFSSAWPEPAPQVSSRAALLMDARTGQVLWEENGYMRRAPASTTKILTAYLALRQGRMTDPVTVSVRAAATPGSRMHLVAGEVYLLRDLLTGLLLRSGNDAAEAIAEHLGGGDSRRFIAGMNAAAYRLGALNTRFENPHGLTATGHYSSAYDLALLARAAFGDPRFARRVGTRETVLETPRGKRQLHNTNALLGSFPGADGVKTGTTDAAGNCLVASATRSGWRLIAVVLKSRDRYGDAARILSYGFDRFQPLAMARSGQVLARVRVGRQEIVVPLAARHPLLWVASREDAARARLVLRVPPWVPAPLQAGRPLGVALLQTGDVPVARTELMPAFSVTEHWWEGWFRRKHAKSM